MTKENNKVDINKHEMDIDTLKKQNVNDLLSIKEIYKRIEELGEKITQVKYIDNTLVKKLKKEYENFKKEYENFKKIILDENIQIKLDNKIDEFNLKLTHDIETINSQMDNIVQKENIKTQKTGVNRKCYLTIIDDDGRVELFTKLKPIFDKHNVKISIAINCNFIGQPNYMTWEQIIQLKNEGHEIINHGWIGKEVTLMTIEEMKAFYQQEKAKFVEKGLGNGYDYFVYSGNQPVGDVVTKNKIKEVYKCSFANYQSKQSYIPFDHYEIKRYPIQLSNVKSYIDYCIENNAYCVLMSHSYVNELTSDFLDDLLNYIKSKSNVEFKLAKYMIDNFENQFENGNTGGDYFYLDKNGNLDFSIQGMSVNDIVRNINISSKKNNFSTTYFSNKRIDEYEPNSVTIELIESKYAKQIGLPDAGMVTTTRWFNPILSSHLCWATQEYICFNSSEKWLRKWNLARDRWNWFTPLSNVSSENRPRYSETGMAIFDKTLGKQITCKTKGYKPNTKIARTTPFIVGDVVYVPKLYANALCIQAGTTGAEEPTKWNSGTGKTTTDGTVIWEWVGADSVWVDGSGAIV